MTDEEIEKLRAENAALKKLVEPLLGLGQKGDGCEESLMLQLGSTPQYPNYPRMSGHEAARRLNAETLWIRSANLEYYYRYAIVEDPKSGKRHVVAEPIDEDAWFTIMKWLLDTTPTVDVVRTEGDKDHG